MILVTSMWPNYENNEILSTKHHEIIQLSGILAAQLWHWDFFWHVSSIWAYLSNIPDEFPVWLLNHTTWTKWWPAHLGIPGSRWFTFAASRSLWARVIDLFRHFCHYTWPHGPIWVMPCAIRELWEGICDDRWAWCKWTDWTHQSFSQSLSSRK
jgi:hypothetical protein